MTEHIIKLPDVGEGITEAEIVEWHVGVGDTIGEDELVGAVMTDKAAVDIPSPVTGRIVELGGEIGDLLAVGSLYVRIELQLGNNAPQPAASITKAGKRADSAPVTEPATQPAGVANPAPVASQAAAVPEPRPAERVQPTPPPVQPKAQRTRPLASPAVRRRAHEQGIALNYVLGSGPAGRISHADLDTYIAKQREPGDTSATPMDSVEHIKVVGLRRQIAQKMQNAKRRIPHFSYVEETDATTLEELRAQLNGQRKDDQPKLTLLPFVIKALTRALVDFPQMNARFDDDAGVISRFSAMHIGIAAQTDRGLLVPVIRNAQALDIWELAREIARLAEEARSGRARREDLTGATTTVSSLGALGGIVTTPVVNYPEVAILGINRIVTRPMYVEDRVVPRKLMNLSSSFDHRVVDGFDAAQFVQRIRSYLEFPSTMFITN